MSSASKCFVMPYFGDPVPWLAAWMRNTERLREHGYDFLFDTDEADFQRRVYDKLGVVCPPLWNTGRIWTFRPAFGVLYADELAGFTHWGHTDYDVVYGRVERWYTDELLTEYQVASNHDEYICGPWTIYQNLPVVNELFMRTDEWRWRMEGDDFAHGWSEKGFSQIVDAAHDAGDIRRVYTKYQTASQDDFSGCVLHEDGRLTEDGVERMMLHFRRTRDEHGQKVYPPRCVLPS